MPNERSVGDVIEVASSIACLAPYFVTVTKQIIPDSLLDHHLGWSADVASNILNDPTAIDTALPLEGDFKWDAIYAAEDKPAKRAKLEQADEPQARPPFSASAASPRGGG